jgi:hypothetical protein
MTDHNLTLARLERNEALASRERARQASLRDRAVSDLSIEELLEKTLDEDPPTLPPINDQTIDELFANWGSNVARIALAAIDEHIASATEHLARVSQ